MKQKLLLIIFLFSLLSAYSQHPWLIKDINATGSPSFPVGNQGSAAGLSVTNKNFYYANGVAFFTADDGIHGTELWRTDGTSAGTFLLADITAGSGATSFGSIYEANNLVYFTVTNAGNSLWRSDGSIAGTFQIMSNNGHFIKEITSANSSYNTATHLGNNFYFIVNDSLTSPVIHSRVYKTDGTVAGTSVYYDAGLTTLTGRVDRVIAFANKIYI